MSKPKIYRKRIIPDEIVDISSDKILFIDDDLIITKWKPIKPRNDFSSGVSYTFIKKGYKISRFCGDKNELLFYYCDVIDVEYKECSNEYIITDLLADVKVYPDGRYEILDIDEVANTYNDNIITKNVIIKILKVLNVILMDIYNDRFPPEICKEYKYW